MTSFKSFIILISTALLHQMLWAQQTPFELGNGNQSATYAECVAYYSALAKNHSNLSLLNYGSTDCGEPLQLVVVADQAAPQDNELSKKAFIQKMREQKKAVLLVMNGIHPGEPEGIDASMMLARDLLTTKKDLLKEVVVCIIPVYNIGGALNRNCCTRANQNGPEMYGFRGNAKNLDLNRDFVKADSKNTWAFWKLYHEWRPDVFIDNHTTNGADYQYNMTLIASQIDKQDAGVQRYMKLMLPKLETAMDQCKEAFCPYVNIHGSALDDEIVAFFESPRYSTGYTTLFGTVSFVAEAHMLKPFKDRVWATYLLMENMLKVMTETKDDLLKRGAFTVIDESKKTYWPINWQLDENSYTEIDFKGYAYEYLPSVVPGQKRLYYNRDKPVTKKVKFYNHYVVSDSVDKPFAYIIPQAWSEVVQRLEANGAMVRPANKDEKFAVECYHIAKHENVKSPYEGHFLHTTIETTTTTDTIEVRKGDFFVILPNRFALETLEPRAPDAFMAWNFFDATLQQKEWFSSYVFEETAARMLEQNAKLKAEFEAERAQNEAFANDYFQQLYWLYRHSPNFEKSFMRYPVCRIVNLTKLPID